MNFCQLTRAKRTPLALALWFAGGLLGAEPRTVFLSWDDNPETNITNYVVSVGMSPGQYTNFINVHPTNKIVLATNVAARIGMSNLVAGQLYCFAVHAVNSAGMAGERSNEALFVALARPTTPSNVWPRDSGLIPPPNRYTSPPPR